MYKTLDDFDFNNKVVFVRADLNVPAKDGQITDMTRITRFIPTLKEIAEKGGRVVIASHFGRPKGKDAAFSMRFMLDTLKEASNIDIFFCPDCIGEERKKMVEMLKPGQALLLENVRFYAGEEANDPAFAKQLADGMDIYIDDAFSTAHRAHASTEGMAHLLPAGAGRLMQEELQALEKALGSPIRPVAALVGGSKVSTKLDLLGNLVKKVDYLLIGGGMAHTFLAAQGVKMGSGSLVEEGMIATAKQILDNAQNCKIVLPVDLTWADAFGEGQTPHVSAVNEVPEGKVLLDIGPQTVALFIDVLKQCKTLIWNGPVGAFEIKPFDKGTNEIALAVADLTERTFLLSVAGGGDTVSALKKAGVDRQLTYVSSAGGAFLEWMEGKTLPGVAVLES